VDEVDLVELNPSSVLRPFLDLIRHEHTSSTLTGAALEAVQHFLQCWDWHIHQASVPDMLADIVDAVAQCRFQETNAESDQHVLVLVVHVLQAVLLCPAADKLSDHAMWQLVEALYALSRANRNDVRFFPATLSLEMSFPSNNDLSV
jgi:golgi-specific brefeldin A-resistance guanine nucleotide exchange factor 1